VARARASLAADPIKCKVLTSAALKPVLDVLLQPLRDGDARHWEVVTTMRVLGVTLSDPTDRETFEGSIRETLRARVIQPVDRLIRELGTGAKPSTAYFALCRFVLPNALYHMQIWGLLCRAEVWAEVDGALSRFCETVCPRDLRGRLAGGLRAELALPQRLGGLGIPRVAIEAPLRAAEMWGHRDATEAGMLRQHAAAFRRRGGDLDPGEMVAVKVRDHHAEVSKALDESARSPDGPENSRRHERNRLRAALWALSGT